MMQTPRARPLLIAASFGAITCCLAAFALAKSSFSAGVPQGTCSVKSLLLDQSAFPPGTTISSDENFEDFAVATAAHTFINLNRGIDVLQTVEYYNATFAAWQAYVENQSIFRKTTYNDGWREPSEIKYSINAADQYRFACTNDTVVGPTCVLHARYGRYFLLFSSAVSPDFTVRDLAPLFREIDARMARCVGR